MAISLPCTPDLVDKAEVLVRGGLSITATSRRLGVNLSTLHKRLAERKVSSVFHGRKDHGALKQRRQRIVTSLVDELFHGIEEEGKRLRAEGR
jgi:transposase-like protein